MKTTTTPTKPLGGKAYVSIPHLIGSKFGNRDDKGITPGQHKICTEKPRPGDRITVQEKLDGTCVSIAKIDGEIIPLIRAGYRALDSHYQQHRLFAAWVYERQQQFSDLLNDGERLCGEWLAQAHGTVYDLVGRYPFVAFDIMRGVERANMDECDERLGPPDFKDNGLFGVVPLLVMGSLPVPITYALECLGERGHYGAEGLAEGVVYRVENNGVVDFVAKYVRPEHRTGQYLPGLPESVVTEDVWNWQP